MSDHAARFLELQTATGWGRTLGQFAAWCSPQPGWLALDVGCGPGLLPALFEQAGCRALGLDLDPAMLRQGRLHPRLVCASVMRLPFGPAEFDLVTASNLLFLLDDPAAALAGMARLLASRGQVCLLNPSEHMGREAAAHLADEHRLDGLPRASLLDWAARAEAHARWSEADLGRLLASAGLRLVETATRVGPGLARLARAVVM